MQKDSSSGPLSFMSSVMQRDAGRQKPQLQPCLVSATNWVVSSQSLTDNEIRQGLKWPLQINGPTATFMPKIAKKCHCKTPFITAETLFFDCTLEISCSIAPPNFFFRNPSFQFYFIIHPLSRLHKLKLTLFRHRFHLLLWMPIWRFSSETAWTNLGGSDFLGDSLVKGEISFETPLNLKKISLIG